MNEINDIRNSNEFTKYTFSNYKKTEVIKELIKSIRNCNHESACYWSAELICGGQFIDLWDAIILYMSKYIHIGNPKLPIYINKCIDTFKDIIKQDYVSDELSLRNNDRIRKLFSEIIITLCDSNKKHAFSETCKVSMLDFDLSNIGNKLKAPHIKYIKNIFKEGDTKEIYVALNELYYNISESKDSILACYWIEWILEFDVLMRKNKKKNLCERRDNIPVHNLDDQISIIWIIWDIFNDISSSPIQKRIINSLLNIFCLKYSKGIPKKRKYIFYYIISVLCDNVNYNVPLIKNQEKLNKVKDNINLIYKEIKKNEILPKTDYLFTNVNKSKKERSIEKLKMLDSIKF